MDGTGSEQASEHVEAAGEKEVSQTNQTQDANTTEGKTANEHGFPDDTPIAQMSSEQQAAYWKYQSRKNEKRLKDQSDYADIKAELAKLKTDGMTDQEKALAAAREEGAKQARTEIGGKTVAAYVTAKLGNKADSVLAGLNRSAFLTDEGELDAGKLDSYLSGWVGEMPARKRDPHQGARQKTTVSGMQAGREMARKNKSTNRKDG